MKKTEKYLLICSQNVGRSQIGEGYLRSLIPNSIVESAGVNTRGMRRKYHNRPHPQVVAVMQEDGIDISGAKITQLRKRHMRRADHIIAFCAEEELPGYAKSFVDKLILTPVIDPASEESGIPVLPLDKLRSTRDKIKQIIQATYEGGEDMRQRALLQETMI